VHQNILRLDIAVNYAVLVCVLQRCADLWQEVEDVTVRDRLLSDHSPEAKSGHVFHDEIVQIARLAAVEDANDVRVRQPGQRPRLVEEAPLRIRVVSEIRTNDLDGYFAIEERLSALVNDSHSTLSQDLGHFEIGQPLR